MKDAHGVREMKTENERRLVKERVSVYSDGMN